LTAPTLSVVIPVHDEEDNLRELHRRLTAAVDPLGTAEIIFVDDGSRDRSYDVMLELARADRCVKIVRLSRNFGHQLAITAGVDFAAGEAVITMDGDLQHPPEVIPELVSAWRQGYQVVYGQMRVSEESRFKRTTAAGYYRLLGRLADIDVPPGAGDFRLLDRKAVEAFTMMRERNRYIRGMMSWIGFRQVGVEYDCPPRTAGKSKYTVWRMGRLAKDGIVGFSDVPLRLALRIGYVASVLAIAFGLGALGAHIAGLGVPGWASLVIVTTFLGGLQLILIGFVGEYVGRIYDEVRGRPLYLISELHGFDPRDTEVAERLGSTVEHAS
jgi:dolichol-phosphate mannosyltransferase